MDFFSHQDKARKKTKVLVVYFGIAVTLLLVGINLLVMLTLGYITNSHQQQVNHSGSLSFGQLLENYLSHPAWIYVSLGAVGIMALGSVIKWVEVGKGGKKIAQMVGAIPLDPNSTDHKHKQLRNVVEEMAIAAGLPVPATYIMPEASINAFVAGTTLENTVLVVTEGLLETLNRQELQGVIGHEFSHILNGDCRINLRLMGLLAGILLISQIGRIMMYSGGGRHRSYGSRSYSSRSSNNKGGNQLALLGIGLLVLGYAGVLAGQLIKAAISRQREFLADASAVQFTRDKNGIKGALLKILRHSTGSKVKHPSAEEVSHMYFADGVGSFFNKAFSTHPPLEARIKAIDPMVQGISPSAKKARRAQAHAASGMEMPVSGFQAGAAESGGEEALNISPEQVGTVSPEAVEHAQTLHEQLPAVLLGAARSSETVMTLLYTLFCAMNRAELSGKVKSLVEAAGADTEKMALWLAETQLLESEHYYALMEIAEPSLTDLDNDALKLTLKTCQKLANIDGKVDLLEYAFIVIIAKYLDNKKSKSTLNRFSDVLPELANTLSFCVHFGGSNDEAKKMYQMNMSSFGQKEPVLEDVSEASLSGLHQSLRKLAQLAPLSKRPVLQACIDCVTADGKVTHDEFLFIRVVSASLGCPMPALPV
jgi:Zn-dependent protease with chaperone function